MICGFACVCLICVLYCHGRCVLFAGWFDLGFCNGLVVVCLALHWVGFGFAYLFMVCRLFKFVV